MPNTDLPSRIFTSLRSQCALNIGVFVAVLIANIITVFWLAQNRVVLNYDGVFYVTLADLIQQGHLDHPMLDHRGFVYSYLIQLTSSLLSIKLETGAYLLNAFSLTLITFAFAAIVKELGGVNRRIFIISVVVIIMFPSLSKYKSMIIRDFIYIAFYMWSMVYFLRYLKTDKITFFFVSAFFLLLGCLFRIESLFYLALVCFVTVALVCKRFSLSREKYKNLGFILSLFVVLLAVFLISDIQVFDYYLGYSTDYISRSLTRFYSKIQLTDKSLVLVLAGSLFEILYEVCKRLEFVYLILAFFAYKKRMVLQNKYQRNIFLAYISLGIIILVLFSVKEGFISSRYTLSVVLTVLVLCPFILDKMLATWSLLTTGKKVLVSLLFLGLLFSSLSKFQYSDRYIERVAGQWIVENTHANQIVISNNSKILYYADQFPYTKRGNSYYRFETSYMVDQYKGSYAQYDYLAFLVDTESELDMEKNDFLEKNFNAPVKQILNPQRSTNKYVNIYKLNK